MAKLCISSQWDNDFLTECAKYGVYEVYGSLRSSAVGSARPAACLPETTLEHAKEHVALAHQLGIKFNYVINVPCMGNMEFGAEGRRAIREYLEFVNSLDVDMVTVAIPYLIEVIKREMPHIKVKTSEIADINSAQRAQYYVNDLGVDALTLEIEINRDFQVLRSIRRAVPSEVELEVVVNPACLFQCPYHNYHTVIVGHSGQDSHPLHGYYMDYCMMRCIPTHLGRPAELMKSRWIRPEDIADYEKIGISRFKISNRVGPKHSGLACLEAYATRKVENLAKLLTPLSLNIEEPPGEQLPGFPKEAWEQMTKIWGMRAPKVFIDNTKLDGFLEHFKKDLCHGQCDSGGCTYCAEWAEKVVQVNANDVADYSHLVKQLIDPLLSLGISSGTDADLSNGASPIAWPAELATVFEQLMKSVPETFQDVARKTIHYQAESLARSRGSSQVNRHDLVEAALSQTPDMFKADLVQTMKSLGLDTQSGKNPVH
jgi:collagenase-like PrtC family protease